jgi:leader peptidase (prepilin peptidase) / N-methyltransferase
MTILFTVFFFAIGAVVGSFLTLASYRIPRNENIVTGRSRCPVCQNNLGVRDLIPLLSWLKYKAACRQCGTKISIRYPLIELATAVAFAIIYLQQGISPYAFILMGLAAGLILMIAVDLEHYIIPDSVHFWLAFLALAKLILVPGVWSDWITALAGTLVGLGIGLLMHYGYYALRKRHGLGLGDVKFFAVAGLWLGAIGLIPFFVLAGLLGIAHGMLWKKLGKGPMFPFGPSLAVSLFLCVVFPGIPAAFWRILLLILPG